MKSFDYVAPRSEAEVLEFLDARPDRSAILAGGTDLVGLMQQMVVTPDLVVNIMEIPALSRIEPTPDGGLLIGATVTLDELLATSYLANYRAVTDAILGINSMQLQSQGTIGGEMFQRPQCWYFRNGQGLLSLGRQEGDTRFAAIFANDGPARFVSSSRLAPALIACGARARVIGPRSTDERWIPVEHLFRIPRMVSEWEHVLRPDQLCTHIELPPNDDCLTGSYEVRDSEGPDFPLAAAATRLRLDGARVAESRTVLGQVAPVPWEVPAVDQFLRGKQPSADVAEQAGQVAVEQARPLADNAYKMRLAKVAVKRAVLRAAELETGGF